MTCSGGELSPARYAQWVENENNGLCVSSMDGDYKFSLQYKPIEYIVAMQQRKPEIAATLLTEEWEKMKDMQYFNFKISDGKGKAVFSSDKIEIEDRMTYLISGMKNDIYLLEGTDTLYCKMFHFENGNGLLPYDNCVLAFDKNEGEQLDKTFLFKGDKLGIDWVKLDIKAKDINRIPKLKTI